MSWWHWAKGKARALVGGRGGALARIDGGSKTASDGFVVVVESDGFMPALRFGGKDADDIELALELATWAMASITASAEAAASLRWVVQRAGQGDEDEWVRERGHELERILRRPFGQAAPWGWQQLIETISMQLDICGNSFLFAGRLLSDGRPRFLHMLRPDRVRVIGQDGLPVRYEYRSERGIEYYEPADIVHIMNASPGSMLRGRGLLQSAAVRNAVSVDGTASTRQRANLKNKIAPGMVITVKDQLLLSDKRERTLEYLRSAYGKASQDGTPIVVGDGTVIAAAPATHDQLDYVNVRDYSAKEIRAITRCPPTILGEVEGMNAATMDAADRQWWNNTLFPKLHSIAEAVNNQLVEPAYGMGIRLWPDLSGTQIGLQLMQTQIGTANGMVMLGYPPNIASQRVGLNMPHVPELDRPILAALIAGRDAAPPSGVPGADVQSQALNGAQMDGVRNYALNYALSVASGELPIETALEFLLLANPTWSREPVERALRAAVSHAAKRPVALPATNAPGAPRQE